MDNQNIAYTEEYIQYRKKFEYLFDEKYLCEHIKIKSILDGKYKLETSYYSDSTHEVHNFNPYASKTKMYNSTGKLIAEFNNIDHHVDFFSVIQHANGKGYLFFAIDLYGYSMMDLSNLNFYHYIPKESFDGQGETFIWTDILYCKENNIIAVEGCIWACPWSIEFYDFSEPEKIPFNRIYSSYYMDSEINIDGDVMPLHWNDDGTILIECYNKDDEAKVTKIVDIESRSRKKM